MAASATPAPGGGGGGGGSGDHGGDETAALGPGPITQTKSEDEFDSFFNERQTGTGE